jgi:hypothetical protein
MIKKIKIKNISDLTIEEYQLLQSYKDNYEENKYNLIKLFTKISNLEKYSIQSLEYLLSLINTVIEKEADFEDLNDFKIDGKKYTFDSEIYKYSAGRFVDLLNFTKNEKKIIDNLHIICAILFREKKRKLFKSKIEEYDSTKIINRSEIFKKKLTMKKALSVCFFLSNLKMNYLETIQQYFQIQTNQHQ